MTRRKLSAPYIHRDRCDCGRWCKCDSHGKSLFRHCGDPVCPECHRQAKTWKRSRYNPDVNFGDRVSYCQSALPWTAWGNVAL